jgi:antitoxin (DNA-binding transcriptional repressor) of toxin-antitoxin stability system
MASHSVAGAKNNLSKLTDQAIDGEEAVITRHGAPVAEPKPIKSARRPVTRDEIEWLKRHRVTGRPPAEDAGTTVSRMRDEDWR